MVALNSGWSGSKVITTKAEGIVAPTGERLALNPTGDGVRVWYTDPYDNTGKVMDVALANQRIGSCAWADGEWKIVIVPNLYSVLVNTYDGRTAKYNTSTILNFGGDDQTHFQAAYSAFSKKINRVACALPNKQQTEIIWKVRDIIDQLDTSAANNAGKKLSNWGFSSTMRCWSSSQFNSTYAWAVSNAGKASYDWSKNNTFGVIPILELDPLTLQPI